MIAHHTLTHAIQYLRRAQRAQNQCVLPTDDVWTLAMIDPSEPCAAYGLAKRTLLRCGSLDAAIKDLESQPEQS